MDGGHDGKTKEPEEERQASQGEPQQTQAKPLKGGNAAGDGADYEALFAERDAKIAELEDAIADAAKTAGATESLRTEMDELRRQGDEQRLEFELTMAGARSVKATRPLLNEHGGDVAKLKEAEPWPFEGVSAPKRSGKTGLPNAGAASDEGRTMKRWHEIAGIADEE